MLPRGGDTELGALGIHVGKSLWKKLRGPHHLHSLGVCRAVEETQAAVGGGSPNMGMREETV